MPERWIRGYGITGRGLRLTYARVPARDPSRDQQRRLNEALNSILTTNVGGGPIDQDVFDEAAAKWDEYFRQ